MPEVISHRKLPSPCNAKERHLTMVNTNIAPQWQLFNSQNWAVLEGAVTTYSNRKNRIVYVFTGTGKCTVLHIFSA